MTPHMWQVAPGAQWRQSSQSVDHAVAGVRCILISKYTRKVKQCELLYIDIIIVVLQALIVLP